MSLLSVSLSHLNISRRGPGGADLRRGPALTLGPLSPELLGDDLAGVGVTRGAHHWWEERQWVTGAGATGTGHTRHGSPTGYLASPHHNTDRQQVFGSDCLTFGIHMLYLEVQGFPLLSYPITLNHTGIATLRAPVGAEINQVDCVVMGDTDTWPAREAELLDIARDDGIEDPGSEPHMLPRISVKSESSCVICYAQALILSLFRCHTQKLGIRLRKT